MVIRFTAVRLLVALCMVCALGIAANRAQAASVYSNDIINNTNPALYWDLDETSGTTANDTALLNGLTTGTYVPTSSSNAIGPRPSDGFVTMNTNNVGASTTTSGKVQTTALNSSAGVGTSAYSMGVWFNSSAAFNTQVLHYIIERGIDNTTPGRRDGIGIGGTFGSTTQGAMFGVSGNNVMVGTTILTPNTWNYALFVRDDSLPTQKFKLYLNGNATPELSGNFTWGGGSGEYFAAGNRTDLNTSLGLNGRFDEVAVWNYALSVQQAQLAYQLAVTPLSVLFPAPEPSSMVLLGLGALVCLRRRKCAR